MESSEAIKFFGTYKIWEDYLKSSCVELYTELNECKLMSKEFKDQVLGKLENNIGQGCMIFYLGNLILKGKSINRLRKNINFIKEFFEFVEYSEYSSIMKTYITRYSAFCIWSKVSRLIILKELKCDNVDINSALVEIKLILKSRLKKLYKCLNPKIIIKCLSICLELARFNVILEHEINQFLVYSLKYLDGRYLSQNYSENQEVPSTLELDHLRLLAELTHEIKSFTKLQNFINKNMNWFDEYLGKIENSIETAVQLFPARISKKSFLNHFDPSRIEKEIFRYNFNQLDIFICEFSHLNSNFNIKYVINPTDELRDSLKNEIETLRLIRRHSKGSKSLPSLIAYSIQDNYISMAFDSHSINLYVYLLRTKQNNSEITTVFQLKWAKSLIKSFYFLEQHEIIHGCLSLQSLFMNEKFELKLYNFSNKVLYQSYYSHPSLPCLPSYYLSTELDLQTSKKDVFALGLILLQIHLLEDLSAHISSEPSLQAKLSTVQNPQLQYLLGQMLAFNLADRRSFRTLFHSLINFKA